MNVNEHAKCLQVIHGECQGHGHVHDADLEPLPNGSLCSPDSKQGHADASNAYSALLWPLLVLRR